MATWPASLPQALETEGFQGEYADVLLRTRMDQGPAKVRRRFTASIEKRNGSITLTDAQLTTFRTFFHTDCAYGALSFDWTHPETGASVSMRFIHPPQLSQIGPDIYRVRLSLEILP